MSGHASRNREAERFIPSGCAECPTCHTIVHERRLADAIPNSAPEPQRPSPVYHRGDYAIQGAATGTNALADATRNSVADLADSLLDGCTIALQEFTTEQLREIADHRDSIHPDGWMQRMIREYVEVWR